MAMKTADLLTWLKEFKYTWFPQTISADPHLQTLFAEKLSELEQFLTENDVFVSEEYPYTQSTNTERVALSNQHALLTPPNACNHANEEANVPEKYHKPAIRIKRIPLAEAEKYLLCAWNNEERENRSDLTTEPSLGLVPVKTKRGRKPGSKNRTTINSTGKQYKKEIPTNEPILSPPKSESSNTSDINQRLTRSRKSASPLSASSLLLTGAQTIRDTTKKNKRKLRATAGEDDDLSTLGNLSQTEQVNGDTHCEQISRYIGQNGILSQTRKTNETMPNIIDTDDFPITLKSRMSTPLTNAMRFVDDLTLTSDPRAMNDDIVINPPQDDQMPQDMIENNDDESIFASLDFNPERPSESHFVSNDNSVLNYNDCIEDISNDGIDPPSSSSPNLASVSLTI